ncbi:MAG: ADOP family duplicated permease [bacterium]
MSKFSSRVPSGVRRLFRLPRTRARMLTDMDDEAAFHVAMRVDELRALGMSEAEAEVEALRRFGDSDEFRSYAARRAARQSRWHAAVDWFHEWTQDARFALRQFRKNPGFTAIAVITLALGIGANTAIFTVVHRLLLAPLPYPDGNRIVMLVEGEGNESDRPTAATLRLWRSRAHSLESIATIAIDGIVVESREEQDTIPAYITSTYLQMLGVHPALGRTFTADEERAGGPPVAMISYGVWQRAYGGRADALGKMVRLEGRAYTIVGVAPPTIGTPMSPGGFRMHRLHEPVPGMWLPSSLDAMKANDRPLSFARLRQGVSPTQASKELQFIADSVSGALAGEHGRTSPHVRRAQDLLDPRETRMIEVLFAAVGVLLLIACANVANLLMSRAWTRRREFAVRIALGAGRGRLARQVLTESLLLALAGGVLGVGVAWQTLKIIIALRPPALENLASVHLEAAVLLWTAVIAVVTGIVFGCAPALFAGARFVGDVLRSETRAGSGGGTARRLRSSLIVFEIAMSLVLLVGAGLLVRSFVALQRIPLGFEPRGLAQVEAIFMLGPPRETRPERATALRAAVIERVRAVPGVTDAAWGTLPGDGYGEGGPLETEPDGTGQFRSVPEFSTIFMSPNYFRLAHMSLVDGRLPDTLTWLPSALPSDASVVREVVVNRGLAQRFWPNGGVIGAHLYQRDRNVRSYTVVGVVDDINMPGPRASIKSAQLYMLAGMIAQTFIVRTAAPTATMVPALRAAAAAVDRAVVVRTATTGEAYLDEALAPTRFAMALLAAFSIVALLLSAIGLYGVIAYAVTQRTREIGIRVALGAEPKAVAGLVVGGGLRLAALGVGLGALAAVAATRALTSLLYAVSPADPATFIAIALLVATIALLASYIPARRALRIDPTEALRAD